MKYCYRCGNPYTEDQCPVCYTDLYTEKPNARTEALETGTANTSKELVDLCQEVERL